ncbi:oxygenase MpaB family protein [Gordonia sp. ABSL49_1]|uniref:oxygenase MpaB family protein n=1 Tax=Gordonia sp. ABSL49_1 TaxID=2920941 RepID=UPI001F114B34|nr:oxygenase MpaB family protein [Gordonia sp. ABSL49_1]MCH5641059.1 oxygenase MpaB family protein [Gordonia sp. ABSL49_1]
MTTQPISSGNAALSLDDTSAPMTILPTSADAIPDAFAAEKPDTEYIPPAARMSRAELDALPTELDMIGAGVLAGPANVIMQLAVPAVGYGVAESKVDSGNLFKHPVKRTRTTLSYLAVAAMGSPEDRKAYRKAVGKAHAKVRSTPDSPVKYNAFDPKLQLWVAACLYKGTEDVLRIYGGRTEVTDAEYQAGAVMGTTLQVPREMWPATRADFEEYWQTTVAELEIDETIRDLLLSIARAEFAGPVVSGLFGWWTEIMTLGFLPVEFRDKMGVRMAPWQKLIFNAHNAVVRAIITRAPRRLRAFPYNILLADVRWRIRTGRPLV